MLKNKLFFQKIILLLSFFFLLILSLFSNFPIYAFNPEQDFTKYQKDNASVHPYFGFKKADGQFFCSKNFNFYGIEEVPYIPCCSYQEWLNKKQATKDSIGLAISLVPIVGGIFGAASDIADASGLTDQFINENKQQIATLTDFIYLRLLENQGKGYFFFDINQLNDIQELKVSFCDCDVYAENIESIIKKTQENHWHQELISIESKINKSLSFPCLSYESYYQEKISNLAEKVTSKITKKIYNKIKQKSLEKIANQKVKQTATQAVAKTASKLGNFFGRFAGFGVDAVFIAKDKYVAQQEAKKYLQNVFNLNIKNNSYEKTLGFFFYFENEKNILLYTITEINDIKKLNFVASQNLDNCTHMLIHVLQNDNKTPITLYGAKLC